MFSFHTLTCRRGKSSPPSPQIIGKQQFGGFLKNLQRSPSIPIFSVILPAIKMVYCVRTLTSQTPQNYYVISSSNYHRKDSPIIFSDMRNRPLLKIFFMLIISILAYIQPLLSSPVDSATARKAATRFYNWKTGRSVAIDYAQLGYIQQTNPQGAGMQTAPVNALYIFNFGSHFVMVSADTRVMPVLGSPENTRSRVR